MNTTMPRQIRPASTMMHSLAQRAVRKVTELHPLGSEAWTVALHEHIETILGPYHKEQTDGFGVRFTKLQPEVDGVHEHITLYF